MTFVSRNVQKSCRNVFKILIFRIIRKFDFPIMTFIRRSVLEALSESMWNPDFSDYPKIWLPRHDFRPYKCSRRFVGKHVKSGFFWLYKNLTSPSWLSFKKSCRNLCKIRIIRIIRKKSSFLIYFASPTWRLIRCWAGSR